MIKVLHVLSCMERGGTEAYVMNNLRNMDRKEFQNDFLVFIKKENPYAKEIEQIGGKIFYCCTPQIKNLKKFIKNVVDCIKENGPYDVVHSHINISNSFVVYAAKKAGVKNIISHAHGFFGGSYRIDKLIYQTFQKYLIKKYSVNKLACSKLVGYYLYGKKNFLKSGKVVKNGIDVDKFIKEPISDKLKKEFRIDDELVFGNISRFDDNKNISFIVDVFDEILKKQPNSVLLLGGVDGGKQKEIQKKVRDKGIADKIRFIGVREDIPSCLKLIDFYLFPSKMEGLGIAVLEAQASGVYSFASTGVSKETDVGINLITYLDLQLGAKYWADEIINKVGYKKPNQMEIKEGFRKKGYDIKISVQELERIYRGEII